jgi:hypothetical protein
MSQRDEQWLLDRIGRITASRFGDAMAKPETKRYQRYKDDLIDERIGLINVQDWRHKVWFDHGIEMEPRAIAAYAFYIGGLYPEAEIMALPKFIKHKELRAGCSPDVILLHEGEHILGAEAKCRSTAETFWDAIRKGLDTVYKPQVQGCMWVTGAKHWHFVNYTEDDRISADNRLNVQIIERDESYISRIEEAVRRLDAEVQAEVDRILEDLA